MSGNLPFTECAVAILWNIPERDLMTIAAVLLILVLLVLGCYTWHLNIQQEREYLAWLKRKGLVDSHRDFHAEFLAEKP